MLPVVVRVWDGMESYLIFQGLGGSGRPTAVICCSPTIIAAPVASLSLKRGPANLNHKPYSSPRPYIRRSEGNMASLWGQMDSAVAQVGSGWDPIYWGPAGLTYGGVVFSAENLRRVRTHMAATCYCCCASQRLLGGCK